MEKYIGEMELTTKKAEFRVDLKGHYIKIFKAIKARHNLRTNVDVFRHALECTEAYDNMDLLSSLHPQLNYTLSRYLIRRDVQEKFSVFSEDDLLKLAVDRIIKEIQEFISERSLTHWDIRSALQGLQKETALAFKELHMASKDNTVTFTQLADKMSGISEIKLKEIMDEFVFQSLVTVEKLGNQIIYHAD